MSLFTKWIDTSSLEKILGRVIEDILSTGTFSSGVLVPRRQVWSRVWERIAVISFYFARSKIITGSCPENVTAVILPSQLIREWEKNRKFSEYLFNFHFNFTLESYVNIALWFVSVVIYCCQFLLDHYKIFTSFSTLRCQVRSSSSGKYTMQYANHLSILIFIFRIHEYFLEILTLKLSICHGFTDRHF